MKLFQHVRNNGFIISIFAYVFLCVQANAQVCPPNIDFENGDFSFWTAYTGKVSAATGQNQIALMNSGGPVPSQHEIFSRATQSSLTDYYGDFPVLCPNGSGYSVKLGNTTGGAEAEGLSYEFTIPAGRNTYSLTYHYAVVFQDPNHEEYQQPRLEIEVENVTDKDLIECSSFTFIPYGTPLPGFFISPQSETVPVWCKNWTAVTINLNGKAGKTIRLSFKTADCTFRRHFGYAYIDVNSECSGEFTGATYCPADTAVNVVAPFGFQSYTWFNSTFSQILGNAQVLRLQPPPATGSLLAVEVTPYDGYGCKDTLYARLIDTLTIKANAGKDVVYCGTLPVLIGENSKPGIRYSWSPVTGLSDPTISNPLASPAVTTRYVLTAFSGGGGCRHSDAVTVTASIPDTALQLLGKTDFCSTSPDSAVLLLSSATEVKWYRDGALISGVNQRRFRVTQSGTYYAMVTNQEGCSLATRSVRINIEDPVPGITYPVQYTFMNTPLLLQARTIGAFVFWQPPAFLDDPVSFKPIFQSSNEVEQKYSITLTTVGGCKTTDTQLVKVIKEILVFVPNAFTPNKDRVNDYFFPITSGIKELYAFKVVNRWGQEIYSMQENSEGWDGTYKNVSQEPGVYIWYLKGLGIDNKIYFRKGSVTLIR
jgi:gliding motility-associated-like protein